jgi:hypothetical protein
MHTIPYACTALNTPGTHPLFAELKAAIGVETMEGNFNKFIVDRYGIRVACPRGCLIVQHFFGDTLACSALYILLHVHVD